ncbi:MAG: response regulator [Cyclobacteriaceae bacterium]
MPTTFSCLAIDDDSLFLRKLSVFVESIEWLDLVKTVNNPVQGAKAIFEVEPDILFLDMEMPHVDGNYLIDWIGPRLAKMTKPPKIIIVSSLNFSDEEKQSSVAGYINKSQVTSAENLSQLVKGIID